ncbi:MAG: hypothetical protein HRT56_04580 [Coraliomargarita sp.]|nr:hypothetical protein [Coraliomargarita sp.]
MASPTNLTDSIAQLREREGGFRVGQPAPPEDPKPSKSRSKSKKPARERRFATDFFMLFAYGLFAAALIIQMVLIVWLDLI